MSTPNELEAVLQHNNLANLVDSLVTRNHYRSLRALGDTASEVAATLVGIQPAIPPGDIKTIEQLWQAARDAGEPKPVATIPELKPGTTVDLSQATATTPDGTFQIPDTLKVNVAGTAWPNPMSLKNEDWMVVAGRQTGLMRGISLAHALETQRADDEGTSAVSDEWALLWKAPDDSSFIQFPGTGYAGSQISYTSGLSNLVSNKFVDVGASIGGIPFVAAAASASRNEKTASSIATKKLFIAGNYRYAYATVILEKCTAPSPAFVESLEAALAASDADARFANLQAAFERYGTVIANKVTLGAELHLTYSTVARGDISEEQVRNTMTTAVNVKAETPAGGAAPSPSGGVTTSFADGTGSTTQYQAIVASQRFGATGGDQSLASNPPEFATKAGDPSRWQIIKREDLKPITYWLSEAFLGKGKGLDDKVRAVWQAGLRKLWNDHQPPADYSFPDFDGRRFTVQSAVGGQLLGPSAISGSLATVAPQTSASDAFEKGLGWCLEYTGATTQPDGKGLPIYRIVEYQDHALRAKRAKDIAAAKAMNEALGEATSDVHHYPVPSAVNALAVVNRFGTLLAGCIDLHEARKQTPGSGAASWTVEPADPGGINEWPSNLVPYVLKNLSTGEVLSTGEIFYRALGALRTGADISLDGTSATAATLDATWKVDERGTVVTAMKYDKTLVVPKDLTPSEPVVWLVFRSEVRAT